jgi:hypothetical protein
MAVASHSVTTYMIEKVAAYLAGSKHSVLGGNVGQH